MIIFINKTNAWSGYIAVFTLAALFFLAVLDIYLRHVFLVFIPGAFELTSLLLSLVVFFAVACAHAGAKHVSVDILYKILPRSGKWVLSLVRSIIYLAITLLIACFIIYFAITQFSQSDVTWALRVPLWIFSVLGAVGMLAYCLSIVGDLISIVRDRGGVE
jgi:TRAP-type C4-dicarboxylate transport system permease small subunit